MDTGVAWAAWPALLVTAGVAYLLALFVFAHWADGTRGRVQVRRWRLPAYTLALAVYCSSWTFFGAVGSAARDGWSFLPIYLGPIIVFLFGIRFLRRLVEVAHSEGSTSIADFIGARFSRSRTVAALVTLIALVGTIPYLALQLRSVGTGFTLMTGGSSPFWPMVITALLLGGFAILFGTRRFETSVRNDGMLMAIAGESMVKILAFTAIGLFALLAFIGTPDAAQLAGLSALSKSFAFNALNMDFVVTTFLAAAAILCLPRQFHIAIVEASAPSDPVRARWPFIVYLAITALLVLPITLEAMTLPELARAPDMVVLALPLREGQAALAVFVFIGGLLLQPVW
jgi:Na+/proline symporter